MQAVAHQELVAMTYDLSELEFNFNFEIPNEIYESIMNGQPLPDFNPDPKISEPDYSVTPPEGCSADIRQNDTIAPLDIFTAPKSTTDEYASFCSTGDYELPIPKVRKLSTSRWVKCSPPPQREPSIWVPIGEPSNFAPSFAVPALPKPPYPDPQVFRSPYHLPAPRSVIPQHSFSSITPPGLQATSLPVPGYTYGGPVPKLMAPPPGRYRHVAPVTNMTAPNQQQGQKRKRAAASSENDAMDDNSDFELFSGRRPPKKLGRPYQYKQTQERREKNKKRTEEYHRRKNDPVYRAKCAKWTQESYERRKQRQDKGAGKTHQVAKSNADSLEDTSTVEGPEYVLGASSEQQSAGDGLRRSSRQSKPRFPSLSF